ncbi:MAG: hypothetical protein HQL82_04900 [Magnetococcales bacterium]|nr:hypothetical protein [Magnetococcales bacterium]
MIIEVRDDHLLYAIILKHDFNDDGVTFLTPNHLSQQLAFMRHPGGKMIQPHRHHQHLRKVFTTQEVLFIKKGRLRVDFYDLDHSYYRSHVLVAGDVILLVEGGHGFQALEPLEMVEVKQGPYDADRDKEKFEQVPEDRIQFIDVAACRVK